MISIRKYNVLLFTFLLCALVATAQVKFTVVPSKTVVQQHETFQLQFVIEGTTQVDEFTPPSFRNFELLSGMDQTNGWTWINGALTEYTSYTVLLRAKLKGKIPIASAIVKAKGKVFTSAPFVIFVTDAGSGTTSPVEEEKPDYYLLPGENAKDKIAKIYLSGLPLISAPAMLANLYLLHSNYLHGSTVNQKLPNVRR